MSRHGRPSLPTFSSVPESWRCQPLSIRVLRAFLGVTFVYAGIQKLADPNFLHAGSVNYIGSQLRAFSEGSPIGGMLRILDHVAVPVGVGIALLEIAIGVGTLLGVAPFAAAVAGLALNFVLFLSATWHVHPYFLGSDSVYALAWAVYLVALWEVRQRAARAARARRTIRRLDADESRRQFLRGGLVAAATVLLGGVARALAGPAPTVPSVARGAGTGGTGTGTGNGTGTGTKTHPGSGKAHGGSGGKTIAELTSLPVGEAIGFSGPGGEPGVLVRLGQDHVAAYSRVCTHAGCLVGYDPGNRILICPCHGAQFDPARGARPIAGPAPAPLPPIRVAVHGGRVVLPT